jgi:hypothetical protein
VSPVNTGAPENKNVATDMDSTFFYNTIYAEWNVIDIL